MQNPIPPPSLKSPSTAEIENIDPPQIVFLPKSNHCDINPANEDRANHVVSNNSRVKLVPRRPPSNITMEVQPSTFQFMPTPGIGITSASQFNNDGPPLNQPGSSTMEEAPSQMQTTRVPLESLVENQERTRKRAAMIKNKRVVRGSVPFAPPRMKRNSATQ